MKAVGGRETYDSNTVIVDMCFLVQLILQFCVFYLRHHTTRVQTWSRLEGVGSTQTDRGIRTCAVDAGVDSNHCRGVSPSHEQRGDKDKGRTVAQAGRVIVGGSSSKNLRAGAELSRVGVGRRGTMEWRRRSGGRRPF